MNSANQTINHGQLLSHRQRRRLDLTQIRNDFHEAKVRLEMLQNSELELSSELIYSVVDSYQLLCQQYAYLSTFYPKIAETQEAYRLVFFGRRLIYGKRLGEHFSIRNRFLSRVPQAFEFIRGYCAIAAVIGILSGLICAAMVFINPHFGWHFLSEDAVNSLRQGKLWTEQIKGLSSLASSQIATNNIKVTFSAFALGITGGVLTVILIIANGAHIGGIFAAVSQYDMGFRLLEFIVAHGFLELSVIVVGAGCGLYLGDALIHPGPLPRKQALQKRARPAVDLMLFSAVWLIPAGIVEGYISPYSQFSFPLKLLLGLLLGTIYWVCLAAGIKSSRP